MIRHGKHLHVEHSQTPAEGPTKRRDDSDATPHERFTRLFVRYQAQVYGYIVTLVPARVDAEDIFQETSIILWRKWEEYDPSRNFLAWSCGIAHNVTRNFLRKHRGAGQAYLDTDFVEKVAQARLEWEETLDARRKALARCVEKLPENHRELIECYYKSSRPTAELARQFGMTANALYLRLSRLRRSLFDCVNRALAAEEIG